MKSLIRLFVFFVILLIGMMGVASKPVLNAVFAQDKVMGNTVFLPIIIRTDTNPPTDLVVFEAFLSSNCGYCLQAAPIIDYELAPRYEGQPVLILEHNVLEDNPREWRWWEGWEKGGSATLPMVMVDSGDQVWETSSGGKDFYNLYSSMIDNSLLTPQINANIQTVVKRTNDVLDFYLYVNNQGKITLGTTNNATIWVLVYEQSENKPVSGGLTRRFVRAQEYQPLTTDLTPGSWNQYILTVDSLIGVDWSRMHAVVILDYRPNPELRPYNIYQAKLVEIP